MSVLTRHTSAWYVYLRDSFWCLPLLLSIIGLICAEVLARFDGVISFLPDGMSVDGARAVLTAIAGSTFGATVTMFSITASVLATASTSYGPRLVRNFMKDRRSQYVLGVYAGTFLYALDTLRFVQSPEKGESFVPVVAIYVALVCAVCNVAVLIYFIHHIVRSTQISTLLEAVKVDLYKVLQRRQTDTIQQVPSVATLQAYPHPISTEQEGYITLLRYEEIAKWAAAQQIENVRITVQPGDYIYRGMVIGSASSSSVEGCDHAMAVSPDRVPDVDIRFAMQQPMDVLLRAMSPGTNDPFTAINALHIIEAGLQRLGAQVATERLYHQGAATVYVNVVSDSDILRTVLQTLQEYDDQHVSFTQEYYKMLKKLHHSSHWSVQDMALISQAMYRTAGRISKQWPAVAYSRI